MTYQNQDLESEIQIFPNPTHQHLQIDLGENQTGVAIVFNAFGQKMKGNIFIYAKK